MDISCVMSIYNEDVWMIKRAMDSMLQQSYPLNEIIVVIDNPNYAEGIDCVEQYIEKYPGIIRCFINSENRGLAYSLNRGIKESKNDYICRMDADDESLPERIECSINQMKKRNLDLVSTNVYYCDEMGKIIKPISSIPISVKAIARINNYSGCLIHPTWLFKKVIWYDLGGYREEMSAAQDGDFAFRAVRKGYRLGAINTPLLRYTIREKSTTGNKIVLQTFLAVYARDCVKKNKEFENDLIQKIDSNEYLPYKKFQQYFIQLCNECSYKNRFGSVLNGICKSYYFRKYIICVILSTILRKYYTLIEKRETE